MKNYLGLVLSLFLVINIQAQQSVSSPNRKITASFYLDKDGKAYYTVARSGQEVLQPSELGLVRNDEDFSTGLQLLKASPTKLEKDSYKMLNAKKSSITYTANKKVFSLQNAHGKKMDIVFKVSNDGVAFRYEFNEQSADEKTITKELTTYHFTANTKGWLQPKAAAKTGWEQTNPSYEEAYLQDIPLGTVSPTGNGFIYPALFKTKDNWLLITEAGSQGDYCATNLNCDSGSNVYQVSFPDPREIITGEGLLPKSTLPFASPWRIITIGSLATITESTLGTDLAQPAIKMDDSFIKPGKSSWSWIMSKDNFIVYDEQKKYIDYAADMHWQYCLIDVNWDTKIGYDKIKELADYAKTRNVGLILWYNSAGPWNTVQYTPKGMLLTHEARQKEFARLQAMGIKGVKIDFFAGDGQSVMKYYTDILKDAADYHLLVNFHGATLPRGWARTYPNLMSAEAVKGFEMVTFMQDVADVQANHCAMLPFTRNAFDPMDFTPMNLYKVQSNVTRKTTSGYELATSVLFLSGIQHYAESPDGMSHQPEFIKNFLRNLPNNWDDVKFIDGFPGKLAIIARRSGNRWYIAGINGENVEKKITLNLAWLKGKTGTLITDDSEPLKFTETQVKLGAKGSTEVTIQPNGGFVLELEL